jgi:predicted Abi (CAAX) family protease
MSKAKRLYIIGSLTGIATTLVAAALLATVLREYSSSLGSNHVLQVLASTLIYVFFWSGVSIALTVQSSLWTAPEWQVWLMGGLISIVYNALILAIVFRVAGHFINKRKSVEHAVAT